MRGKTINFIRAENNKANHTFNFAKWKKKRKKDLTEQYTRASLNSHVIDYRIRQTEIQKKQLKLTKTKAYNVKGNVVSNLPPYWIPETSTV